MSKPNQPGSGHYDAVETTVKVGGTALQIGQGVNLERARTAEIVRILEEQRDGALHAFISARADLAGQMALWNSFHAVDRRRDELQAMEEKKKAPRSARRAGKRQAGGASPAGGKAPS